MKKRLRKKLHRGEFDCLTFLVRVTVSVSDRVPFMELGDKIRRLSDGDSSPMEWAGGFVKPPYTFFYAILDGGQLLPGRRNGRPWNRVRSWKLNDDQRARVFAWICEDWRVLHVTVDPLISEHARWKDQPIGPRSLHWSRPDA